MARIDKQEIIDRLDIEGYYSSELPSLKSNGSGMAMALCPHHNDTKPSLSVNLHTGFFKCFGCLEKGSVFDFYMKQNKVDYRTAFNALTKEAGLITEPPKKIVKTYDYVDESGDLLFQTVRYDPKDFKQRKPDDKGGWIYSLKGVRLVPYNLTEVLKAKSIIIVEGEKDVERLKSLGLVATCNPMGGGKWRTEYNQYFKGKRIVVIPDNDDPGKKHAQQVAKNLKGMAESVKVVELPDLQEKGDVTDWLNSGGTKDSLIELIKKSPEWEEPKEKDLIDSLPTLSEISSLDLTVEYIVKGLIPERSITILYGKGGRGKTTLMIQVGYCVAEDLPFEGLATKKTPVVYIDFDNPLAVVVEKARRLGGSNNFYYWHVSHELRPSKMDMAEWEIYKRLPKNALLIFDTLKSCQGLDMNKDETMAFILERFRELRDMGFTIVLLHHTPKSSDTIPKNNTTITDNADHVLGLVPLVVDGENNKDGILRFGCGENDKSRYPKNHICLSFDGEMFERVSDPEDAKFEDMKDLIAELIEKDGLPNQSKIVTASKEKLDISRPKTIDLLNRGEGKFWKSTRIKERKNQKIYELISVVKLSDPYIGATTEQLPENSKSVVRTTPPTNTPQTLDNTELSSCQGGIQLTQTTDKCTPCSNNDRCLLGEGQKQLCQGPFNA